MPAFLNTLIEWAMSTGLKVIIALIILLVSFRVITVVGRKLEKKLVENQKLDKTLTKFLLNAGKILLRILVVCCLIGYLGIETTGISAVIGSLGVCVGLAVNGALANLAGGMLILLTRPFKIGDYISAQGVDGTVEDIHIISTKIVTVDNKVVYLPNGALSSGNITNFSEKDIRRVDLDFSIAGNDPELVRSIALKVCSETENVLLDPTPFARVTEYGAGNGTKLTVRAWCNGANYWDVRFDLLENMKVAFDQNNIVVPFNQLDVHIKND